MTEFVDPQLEEVKLALLAIPHFERTVATCLRQALDEVIDGPRSGRYRIEELEKTEKTYIGTKVEILLRHHLELSRGQLLDNLVAGHEVDTKFSISENWMIPSEADGHICMLVAVNDNQSVASLGLLRINDAVLTRGKNRDSKKTVSAIGKRGIHWLMRHAKIPENTMLHLDAENRSFILKQASGRKRVEALFSRVTDRLIPRAVVLQVIRLPGDPLKRAREAKANLEPRGFRVLCGTYASDRLAMQAAGFCEFADDDWLSLPIDRNQL